MRKIWVSLILILSMAGLARAQQRQALSAAATTCTVSGTSCLINSVDPTSGGATFTVSANASANTLQFEASGDGGTTWVALSVTPSNSSTTVTSTTSTGTWQANVAAYTFVRIRMSTLVGGTSTVSIIFSTASARGGSGGGGGGSGTITGCTANRGVAWNNGSTNTLSCDGNFIYNTSSAQLQLNSSGGGTGIALSAANTGASGGSLGGSIIGSTTINGSASSPNTIFGIEGLFATSGSPSNTGVVGGFLGGGQNGGSGTLLNAAAFNAAALNNTGGGTITNAYGFYAEAQTAGTNNYGFYDANATGNDVMGNLSATSVAVPSDGVHAGIVSVVGNTTAPTIPANSFGFIGPNSASFTKWVIQPPATAPAASCIMTLGAVSANISALTCPTTIQTTGGSNVTPSVAVGASNYGLYNAGTNVGITINGTISGFFSSGIFNENLINLSSAGYGTNNDTGVSRDPTGGAGFVDIGNGTLGDFSGTVKATGFNSGASVGVSSSGVLCTATFTSVHGLVTACTAASDPRLKILGSYSRGLDVIMNIQPIHFHWNKAGLMLTSLSEKENGEQVGFSAKNVKGVMPEAVGTEIFHNVAYLSLPQGDRPIVAALVNAVKEQQVEIEELRKEVAKLMARK